MVRLKQLPQSFLKDRNNHYQEYTIASRDEIIDQFPSLKKKYLTYKNFAEAPFEKLFSPEALKKYLQSHANYFSSSFIKNLGNGKFELQPLPPMAQLSPVFGIGAADFNGDGYTDVFLTGNDYGSEVFNGRLDAMNGLVLKGNGKGGFNPLSIRESGVYIPLASKALTCLKNKMGQKMVIVSQQKGKLKVFAANR